MSAIEVGRCLSVSLIRTDIPFAPQVATIAVAERARCGDQLWRVLHDEADPHELATHGQSLPPEPWCAELLDTTRPLRADGTSWRTLQEFEKCIAWAFLDRLAGDPTKR
jgi:hypothetical protein